MMSGFDAGPLHPGFAEMQARRRKRRPALAPDGRLVILAVDHPGRNAGKDPTILP